MENLQNLLSNVGNWMGYPICDLIGSETDDEVEDFSKIDYDLRPGKSALLGRMFGF